MATKIMTWGEFVKFINKKLEEKGYPDDPEVWYIDVSYPRGREDGGFSVPYANIGRDGTLTISN